MWWTKISHELAIELGYDAGFGSGTYANEVASYIVVTLAKISPEIIGIFSVCSYF